MAAAGRSATDARPRLVRRLRLNFGGLAGAVVCFCLSVTPSLLPRDWRLQGVSGGLLTAAGYGLGVLITWLTRALVRREPGPAAKRLAWRLLIVLGAGLVAVFVYLGSGWQRDLRLLIEAPAQNRFLYLGVAVVAVAVMALFIAAARGLSWIARAPRAFLDRQVTAPVRVTTSVLLAGLLAFGVTNGIVVDGTLVAASAALRFVNDETAPAVAAPGSALVSGGPGSVMSWASLGIQGRRFVTQGPTVDGIGRFSGRPAMAPIRVYAGLGVAASTAERAALAVRDLERTGAFSRAVLCVVTTTGTGWVDPHPADVLEYLYNGNTAEVGMQYSYLSSASSFIVDKQRAKEAGRELFNQVYARWSILPAGQRPKLLVFGESLGAYGGEAAFDGVDDIRNRADGVLWVGPPNANTLWREFTRNRKPGTPEVLPVYQDGHTVRYASGPSGLDNPGSDWKSPRVVYLQYASDPIVWWSTDLIFRRPDWLREPAGTDRLPQMRWLPFVTFWQTTVDMAVATNVPPGHGHRYGSDVIDAWVAIAPPAAWTPERTAALKRVVGD
jgi:uncharacterized membrane protein